MRNNLERIRQCCGDSKLFLILFDGADTADLPVLICQACSHKSLFQKFIKAKLPINSNSDIKEILRSL